MSLIKKLFGSREAKFRDRVLAEAAKQTPALRLEAGETDLEARWNDVRLDLKDLFAICSSNELQATELIHQYLSYPAALSVPFSSAASALRPQLVPAAMAARFGVLSFPFTTEISVCITSKEGGFARAADIAGMGMQPDDLLSRAIENLDADPYEKEVTATEKTDRFIGLETHDGFDAARILLPRLREFAATKLGEPFYAGIPNRNFLILWARDCSSRFHDYATEKIETDFSIQPFPLSKKRFEVTRQKIDGA